MSTSPDEFVNEAEASRLLGISWQRLYKLRRRGDIVPFMIGPGIRPSVIYRRVDVLAFKAKREATQQHVDGFVS